ncbi:MAG: glycerophosphodiester phosphodiesterase family protein [Litorimonas sp.]
MDWKTLSGDAPIVIAHRGASGILPEHTLAAYERAIEMGADYIEPDLVITKDGHLVARHDRYLSGSTNVSDKAEFADRRRSDPAHTGLDWFVEDFTLAEIKTLKARQPRDGRSKTFDDQYEIPTFQEILNLVASRNTAARQIGIYPETKQPAAFARVGLSHDESLLNLLALYGYDDADAPIFIQSFELENLKRLNELTDLKLIFLTQSLPDFGLIAETVDGVGPYKKPLIGKDGVDTGFVKEAHSAGLAVHPWTFRDDQLDETFADIETEMKAYYELGVDGVFSDFADTAIRVRDAFDPNE